MSTVPGPDLAPELHYYLLLLSDLRKQVRALVADLPAAALNWRPLPDVEDHATNSLAVLAAHIAGAEHFWIAEIIGGHPPTRDRLAEFALQVEDAGELLRRLDAVGEETRAVFARLTPADLDDVRTAQGKTMPVRWGILHIIDHTALHLGHMQITYQLWMGGRSMPTPRWYERLQ